LSFQTDYIKKPVSENTLRPLQHGTLCPISVSGSNFNPRNMQYIPVVEIFAFLELEKKLPFFKGLTFIACTKKDPVILAGILHMYLFLNGKRYMTI
jgi:hypothetical protein